MARRIQGLFFRHILPNLQPYILVAATLGVAGTILTESALSFLGLGVQIPQASWGSMLNSAQSLTVLTNSPWLWLPPGIAISVAVLAMNFVGDGLRDAFEIRVWRCTGCLKKTVRFILLTLQCCQPQSSLSDAPKRRAWHVQPYETAELSGNLLSAGEERRRRRRYRSVST